MQKYEIVIKNHYIDNDIIFNYNSKFKKSNILDIVNFRGIIVMCSYIYISNEKK